MSKTPTLLACTAMAATLAACSTTMDMKAPEAPAAVSVPAGHRPVLSTVGIGELAYECRAKVNAAGHEWVFAGPNAVLYDSSKAAIGKYYGGPTWEANDGSKVTGKQLAVAPSTNAGAIPLQLVQAGPATGSGAMSGVTYIQRLNTMGGTMPAESCDAATAGTRKIVKYQADYVFYKAS